MAPIKGEDANTVSFFTATSFHRSPALSISVSIMDPQANSSMDIPLSTNGTTLQDSRGWDGKLRVDRRAVVTNAEILSDPEYSDEDAPPVDQINVDEGTYFFAFLLVPLTYGGADLLDDYELDTDVRCEGSIFLNRKQTDNLFT